MKLTAIIVDDEPLARKLISNLLESVSEVEIVGLYGTGKEAIGAIDRLKPDLLFLDIQLKDMNGFGVLEQIQVEAPLTIFATAFDSYAIEAFNIFAFDYLLKPFTEDRFYRSVFKAIDIFKEDKTVALQETMTNLLEHVQTNVKTASEYEKRIPVPYGNKTVFVNPVEIKYIRASNYYIEIYASKAKYVLRNSMNNIMQELDKNKFARIHRSTIINLSYIEEVINSNHGEIDVKMHDLIKLRISKGYRKAFLIKMGMRK